MVSVPLEGKNSKATSTLHAVGEKDLNVEHIAAAPTVQLVRQTKSSLKREEPVEVHAHPEYVNVALRASMSSTWQEVDGRGGCRAQNAVDKQ